MSEHWPVIPLGELCQIKTGRKDANQGSPNGKYPFFTCAKEHIWSDEYSFEGEALLIAGNGDVGNTMYYDGKFEAYQRTYVLMDFKGVSANFLFYALSDRLKAALVDKKLGSTMPYIKKGMLSNFPIIVPPMEEQQRIVTILDEAFKNIENQTRKTEQKMDTGDGFLNSYIYKIFSEGGENWTEKTIEETCKLISGQHILAADYNTLGNGIGYLTGPADFGIENPVIKRWTEKPKVTAIQGDILITVKGSGVGKINRLSEDEVAISRQLMAIRSNGEIDSKFLFYFISIQYDMFQGLATGAAIPGISRSDVLKLQIPYPPLNEQIRIVKRLDDFTNQSQEFSKICDVEIDSLSELKQSILQEAFNGNLTKEITA